MRQAISYQMPYLFQSDWKEQTESTKLVKSSCF